MKELATRIARLSAVKTEAAKRRLIPLLKEWLAANDGDTAAWYRLACCYDFLGRERLAEPCYARVYADWRALPAAARPGFFVGYGSTLRNNGRLALSCRVLKEGARLFPDNPELKAFLALSLHSSRDYRGAARALFGACAQMPVGAFGGYERALGHYVARILRAR